MVTELRAAGAAERLQTLLLVGAPTDAERAAAQDAAGAEVTVRSVHAPAGARLLWAECREAGAAGGLHTYPDLDLVQLVDPESGDNTTEGGEVVLTQSADPQKELELVSQMRASICVGPKIVDVSPP